MKLSSFIFYSHGGGRDILEQLQNWIADRIECAAVYDDQRGAFVSRAINNALELSPGSSMQWGGVIYQICEAAQ